MPINRYKWKSPQELQTLVDDYFRIREKQKKPLTVSSLAVHLDTTRQTIINYQNDIKFKDIASIIKKAKAKIEAYGEDCLFMGNHTAGYIFSLKNNYDWKDKVENINTNTNTNYDVDVDKLNDVLDKAGV